MGDSTTPTLQDVLETVEMLPDHEQEKLIRIIHQRLVTRRQRIAGKTFHEENANPMVENEIRNLFVHVFDDLQPDSSRSNDS
ncbi:MAG: hypothetical protein D6675_08470 [Gemmatimonadetes bacterium]|nr:MAG: hypothetical protein D6675_08470 [Gemmatimonadota bacterium]